ncbi:MAG: type II secretion system protein [Pseudomonadota bacterium]
MAIVLVIVGVLLGGLIVPITTQLDARKRTQAETQLREVEQALLGFAASTGRLPCPATATSAGLPAPNVATTACTTANGFVPVRALGLQGAVDGSGRLLDPWLNPLRYSISAAGGGTYTSSIPLALVPDLTICEDSACSVVIADAVVAIVISQGEDGSTTTSADQLENVDGDLIFVERLRTELTGAEFDDHLVWISPNTLTYQLVRAGRFN